MLIASSSITGVLVGCLLLEKLLLSQGLTTINNQSEKACDLECKQEQRRALLDLYESTNGRDWVSKNGWNDGEYASHCDWYGVHCCTSEHTILIEYVGGDGLTVNYGNSGDSFGHYCPVAGGVVAITLSLNNLHGSLPEDIFSHFNDSLQYLDLHRNKIYGEIPHSVRYLNNLKELSLSSNDFHGHIPNLVGSLSTLLYFDLGVNNLSGTIPRSLVNLELVEWIILNDNHLTGSVPIFLFRLKFAKIINLTNNNLSGSIREVEQDFAATNIRFLVSDLSVEELRLRNNQIMGTIPSMIAALPLRVLDLGWNNLEGSIPDSIARSPFLTMLFLDNNQLQGSIPISISRWNLMSLDLSSNKLTGTIPLSLTIRTLTQLNFRNNSLTGKIPDSFKELSHLNRFDISLNPGMVHKGKNSHHEQLPEYMRFSELGLFPLSDKVGLSCPQPIGNLQTKGAQAQFFRNIKMSPEYFGFQFCECGDARAYKRREVWEHGALVDVWCDSQKNASKSEGWKTILVVIVLVGILVPMGLWTLFRYRYTLAGVQMNLKKRRGPPQTDREITLVLTDVEASTELWEWDTGIMSRSIDIHDRVMRAQLSKFFGYEITTEGDAFLVAFHEPHDALAWCLSLQNALLAASWPPILMEHKRTAVENMCTLQAARDHMEKKIPNFPINRDNSFCPPFPLSVRDRMAVARWESAAKDKQKLLWGFHNMGILYRGLRVRMGIATGMPESMKMHKLTRRAEYFGEVVQRVQSLSDAPHGGQVLMDQETFSKINSRLDQLGGMVGEAIIGCRNTSHRRPGSWWLQWLSRHVSGKVQPGSNQLETQGLGSKREGISGMPKARAAANQDPPNGCGPGSDPQSLFDAQPKDRVDDRNRRSSLMAAIKIIDMGIHKLKGISQPNNLVQAIVFGLEERARFFPPLNTEYQLTPGYFDAAGTRDAPLRATNMHKSFPIEPVTLVFCGIKGFKEAMSFDRLGAEEVLTIYNDCIRRTLLTAGGYECQEQEGNFMIGFSSADAAVEWCLLVQEVMMEIEWTDHVLRIPGMEEVTSPGGQVLFRGPRVRMGVYEGIPTRVIPHSTTGRADYFGQFVNRTARFCYVVAQGGQVVVSGEIMEQMIVRWCGMCEGAPHHPVPLYCTVTIDQSTQPNDNLAQDKWRMYMQNSTQPGLMMSSGMERQSSQVMEEARQDYLEDIQQEVERRHSAPNSKWRTAASYLFGNHNIFRHSHTSDTSCGESVGHGSSGSGCGEMPKYMNSFSVSRRYQVGHWIWMQVLEAEDLGKYRFKGVTGFHRVVSVKSKRLLGRKFDSTVVKGKGDKVAQGSGVLFCVTFAAKGKSSSEQTSQRAQDTAQMMHADDQARPESEES